MNQNKAESEFLTIREEEFLLSGAALTELARATLAKNACFRLKVKGFSMSPFIRNNDVVTISPLRNPSTNFGQAVAFVNPQTDKLIIHRVIGKASGFYLIKGDKIFNPDGLIPKENILGCVGKIERNNKNVYFGLGFERVIVAFLSRIRLLNLVFYIWRLFIIPVRRISK